MREKSFLTMLRLKLVPENRFSGVSRSIEHEKIWFVCFAMLGIGD
jgi:hypothetical protein